MSIHVDHQSCESQICLLQEKLIQTHSKLLQQYDIIKDQEVQIIELNKQLERCIKLNSNPNYPNVSNLESKNQLLQVDLEAMRNKILTQMLQKKQLEEKISQIEKGQSHSANTMHVKITALQAESLANKKRITTLQEKNKHLLEQNNHFKTQIARLQQENKKISNEFQQLRMIYHQEAQRSKQFIEQNSNLQQRIYQLRAKLTSLQNQHISHKDHDFMRTLPKGYGKNFLESEVQKLYDHKQNRQGELKAEIDQLNALLNSRQKQLKNLRGKTGGRRKAYEATRELIKKLQQAQKVTRKANYGKSNF